MPACRAHAFRTALPHERLAVSSAPQSDVSVCVSFDVLARLCRAEDLGQESCMSRCLVRRRRRDWFESVCKLDCCSIQCFRT